MMIVIYILFAIAIVSLCLTASISDLRTGFIYNKTLQVYVVIGLILDAVFYGFLERDYLVDFFINFLVMVAISLVLFYTHSLAGGDCKLLIVLALIYPASACVNYDGSCITLSFVPAFAVLYGYIYLVISSLINLLTEKTIVPKGYFIQAIKAFILNYFRAIIYISLITIGFYAVTLIGIELPNVLMSLMCFGVAWIVGKSQKLRKWKIVIPILGLVVLLSINLKIIPISLYPRNYVLVTVLMLCQMTARTNLYEEISLKSLKKGMILAMTTTILFQNSRVRGLPGISTEDLRSRLTEDEVKSILRWSEGRDVFTITIVKKIPFAIFISLGVLSYYILWGQFW